MLVGVEHSAEVPVHNWFHTSDLTLLVKIVAVTTVDTTRLDVVANSVVMVLVTVAKFAGMARLVVRIVVTVVAMI